MFVDLPPGTGYEPLSVMQLIPDIDGVIIVAMPSEVSESVVKKSVSFAKQVGVSVIGIIENMSGFVCPECGAKIDVFKAGGGKRIANDMNIPFLGAIPLDPRICADSDGGLSFLENKTSPASIVFEQIVSKINKFLPDKKNSLTT